MICHTLGHELPRIDLYLSCAKGTTQVGCCGWVCSLWSVPRAYPSVYECLWIYKFRMPCDSWLDFLIYDVYAPFHLSDPWCHSKPHPSVPSSSCTKESNSMQIYLWHAIPLVHGRSCGAVYLISPCLTTLSPIDAPSWRHIKQAMFAHLRSHTKITYQSFSSSESTATFVTLPLR